MDKQTKIDMVRLQQAILTASQSACIKHSVGCIITNVDNRIVGEGYNGTPHNHVNCNEKFHNYKKALDDGIDLVINKYHEHHHIWSESNEIHAEMNALLYSDRSSRIGGTLYSTHQPCDVCAKHIAASGVKRVVYGIPYHRTDQQESLNLFKQSDIDYIHLHITGES